MTTPPLPTPPAAGGTQVLSRELSAFLVEFSIALHKNQIYPPGHPHLNTALIGFNDRLHALLTTRPSLSIGVARRQLVIEGVATDPANPLLRELALKLHRHQLGAIKVLPDVDDHEVADFLAALAVDAYQSREPLGRPASGDLRRWEHIWLFPLAYDQLELIEDDPADPDAPPAAAADRGRGGQLWVGLASAALAGDGQGSAPAPASVDPTEVAKAIDEHARETTYDQVVVGYLLQIADELKTNPEGTALNRRVSRLVNALRPDTLRRLLEMGGDVHQRQRFVLDASNGMAVNAVMDLVKAAADASEQTISHSLVRLLNKLAVHAEVGSAREVREGADRELREHVRQLVSGWTLDDPNPNAYTDILEGMSRARPAAAPAAEGAAREAEPERLLQMAVEVEALGETVIRAADTLVAGGRLGAVLDILEQAPKRNETVVTLLEYVVTPERLRALLADEGAVDFTLVDRLALRLGAAAAEPLLDAYAAAEQRAVRRKLHDRVAAIGPGIAPHITARLEGTPWYVQRNMLTLLAGMPAWPAGFDPAAWSRHDDARVRREAYRLLFRLDDRRAAALAQALDDPDEGIRRMALGLAAEGCPLALGPRLSALATDAALPAEVRAQALRVLGSLGGAETLTLLLSRAVQRGGLLRRLRLLPRGPEMLAALAALAQHYPGEDEADAAVALAAGADDPQVRAAVRRKGRAR
ncbi:MAG TPA: hypothetical protein VFS07_08025 [Gemmatimonadales bacterium]|nr:hypothetical protein [Gemmatimonadales bacterium]